MKKSHIVSVVLTVAILFSCLCMPQNVSATETTGETSEDIVLAKEEDFTVRLFPVSEPTEVRISKYTGSDKKIIIPDTIQGLPVTRIGSATFKENEQIEYVKLPSTMNIFSARAFEHCSSLSWIDVDSENPYFTSENGILFNKDKTTLVAFPVGRSGNYSVPEGVVSIGDYAFYTCQYLTKIHLPNSVQSIGDYSFKLCSGIYNFRFSDNLSIIGKEALMGCESLKEIHLPYSLTDIGQNAFLGDVDSDSNYIYFFNQGIYYVAGTYSEKYVKNLHLAKGYAIAEYRTVSDSAANITLIDTNNILPKTGTIEFVATPLDIEVYKDLIPIRYNQAYAYNLSLKVNGKAVTLSKPVVLRFGSADIDAIDSATKVFAINGNSADELFRQPYAPFVGAQVTTLGKYIVVTNNDFSLPGDIDGDGIVTTYDTQFALCIVADLVPYVTPEQFNAANVDSTDGEITTNDAVKILRYAAGIEKIN